MLHCLLFYGRMNYQNDLKQSYSYNLPTGTAKTTYVFFSDGSGANYTDFEVTDTFYVYLGQVCNQARRDYPQKQVIACEYFIPSGNQSHLFLTNRIDYFIHGGAYNFGCYKINDYVTANFNTGISTAQDYPTYNAKSFTEYTYGTYSGSLNSALSVFDFSNINYESGNQYYSDTFSIEGENVSFYTHFLTKIQFGQGTLSFAYGSPLYEQRNAEYNRGYGAGYSSGWTQGNDNGYQIGINQNGNIEQAPAQAFDYIGGAFGAVSNIMSLEVLPNITLGLAFSIPMVFVLIMTIFKLVRK